MLQKQVAGQFGFKLLFERQARDQTGSERGHAALHLIDELTLQFDLGGQRVHAREKYQEGYCIIKINNDSALPPF
jgi:hypothetical protein